MEQKAIFRIGLLLLYMVIGICLTGNSKQTAENRPAIPAPVHIQPRAVTAQFAVLETAVASRMVFICQSKGAKRFHYKESCHGLRRCTHKIEKVTRKEAEGYGLTVCKYED